MLMNYSSYLRDRWDHSPLCPTSAWHVGTKSLPQTGDDQKLLLDPSIISGSQSLSLWLQEDETLHSDACGIMDVFLGLIKEGKHADVDYGTWLMPAILALSSSEKGREEFNRYNGYNVVRERLETLKVNAKVAEHQDANNDLEIMRIVAPEKTDSWERAHIPLVNKILSAQ